MLKRVGDSHNDAGLATRRIALYSPGMVGLGHVRRNLLITQSLADSDLSASTLLIAEARQASAFAMPPGTDCLTLPALRKDVDGQCNPRYLDVPLLQLVALRSHVIRAALDVFQPDALIVDHLPRGAVGELEPALKSLRARGRTRCILGLRDVLEDPPTVRREWSQAGNETAIREYYDAVWVYGDPKVYDLVKEYQLAPDVASMVRHTGYLDQRRRLSLAEKASDPLANLGLGSGQLVLCLVGGGQDGQRLADAVSQAKLPPGMNVVILTGPFMPAEAQHRLRSRAAASPRLRVLEFVSEPTLLLRNADRVIAMGGYNTITEVLSFEKHSLIVPREEPRPEQLIRAERLLALGLIDLIHPSRLSPDAIGTWLARDLGPPPRVREKIDLDGLSRLPGLLAEVLAAPPRFERAATPGQDRRGVQRVAA